MTQTHPATEAATAVPDRRRLTVPLMHRSPNQGGDTTTAQRADVSAPPATDSSGHPRKWAIMAVLGAVAFMAQLDFFIVNVALDGIGKSFPGSSESSVSWVLSAYAIVFAAVLVPAGRVADLYGRKKVLLTGVAIFTAASALASFAPVLGVLIVARAIQAIGAAMIVPTSLGLLYPSFPKHQHTLVVGIWAGVAGIAASAGPPIGGLLVTVAWRLIFLINLPIGIATIVAGMILLPEVRQPSNRSLPDATSALALLFGVSVLVLATVEGPAWGWTSGRTLGLFAAAVVFALVTLQRTFKATSPIIEKELFRSREFTAATIALLAFFIAFSIFLLGGALFMQNVWHFSPLRAGLGIAPAPIVSVPFALRAGAIRAKFGRTIPAVVGTLLMAAAALYWLLAVGDSASYWTEMFPGLVLMGISGGLSQAPMFAAAGTLDPNRATTGSAVLNMSRQVGSALGVALLVALTAASNDVSGFDHAWTLQLGGGVLAAIVLLVLRDRRTTATKS